MVTNLSDPSISLSDESRWLTLGELAGASRAFTAIEIKAYYVFGLVHDIALSVHWLLQSPNAWPNTYFPAVGVFASAVEVLGRCLTGNPLPEVNENLRVGFFYLAHPCETPPKKNITNTEYESIVVETGPGIQYRVVDLVTLRHYGAHGQATTKNSLPSIDSELLEELRVPFAKAIETYWTGLRDNDEYCRRMGEAEIVPYANRSEPLRHAIEIAARGDAMSDPICAVSWQVAP